MAGNTDLMLENNADLLRPGWRESFKNIKGVNLHIVEAGVPGNPAVILLHGFPEFWWAWRHLIAPLVEAGFYVVVPDQRGYNLSDKPQKISDYKLNKLAADVVGIADALGIKRFDLVAHDWGSVIGWWVGAKHAERLNRSVLMDGLHPDVLWQQALKHPTQAMRSMYVAFFQLPWLPEAMLSRRNFAPIKTALRGSARAHAFESGAMAHYAKAWAHPGSLTAMLNYYRALRYHQVAKPPARLSKPTLVLHARGDKFLEPHVAEASLALCDDGVLEMVEDATHWLHLEQPDYINARIIKWLSLHK